MTHREEDPGAHPRWLLGRRTAEKKKKPPMRKRYKSVHTTIPFPLLFFFACAEADRTCRTVGVVVVVVGLLRGYDLKVKVNFFFAQVRVGFRIPPHLPS